jgi:hypothetical protein
MSECEWIGHDITNNRQDNYWRLNSKPPKYNTF